MTRRTIEIAAFCVTMLVAAMAVHAWLASRDDQQRLASTLAAQKQLLDAADTREHARQSALDDTLAQIEKLKRATQTPEEILRDLPKYLSLPQPITLTRAAVEPSAPPTGQGNAPPASAAIPESAAADQSRDRSSPAKPSAVARGSLDLPSVPAAQIPSADLKPLYDYVQDCRACQTQLAAAKQNASDDASKIVALTRERDAAITAAKGGAFWRRLRRNAIWFGIGAALGAAAGYSAQKH
jgi:hypothetical protein